MGEILAGIPAFNEEKTIGSIVLSTLQYVDRVLVIDDGSRDNTAWVAARAGATVVKHGENSGYGSALRTCFEYAKQSSCRALVVLDGDGQHPPEMIPKIVGPILKGEADICIGSRFLDASTRRTVPIHRRVGIRVLTTLTNFGAHNGKKVKDAQSGFRAYSPEALDKLEVRETAMGASTEILWQADKHHLRTVEVSTRVEYDVEGSTQAAIPHAMSVIGSMVRYVETEHPLLSFGTVALILMAVGTGLGIRVVDIFHRTSQLAIGLSLLTVMLMTVSTLLAFTGLILHAVLNANRRKQ